LQNYGLSQLTGEDASDISSPDDPMGQMIKAGVSDFKVGLPSPRTLTREEMLSLEVPVYVGLADRSPITVKSDAEENARLIPNSTVKIWENTTHSLPMQIPKELGVDLNNFWDSND